MRFASSDELPILHLAIGCGSYNLLRLLESTISDMNQLHQNFHPYFYVEHHDRLFRLLDNEALDIVFDIHEVQISKKSLIFKELYSSKLVCACRSDVPLTLRESVTKADLCEEKLIFAIRLICHLKFNPCKWNLRKAVILLIYIFAILLKLPALWSVPDAALLSFPTCWYLPTTILKVFH